MYTTDEPPNDDRTVVAAFLVCTWAEDLNKALRMLEGKAKLRGGTAIVGLRISAADGSHYVPAETFIGGGTTQKDMGASGYRVDGMTWTVYGTAIRRSGDDDPTFEAHMVKNLVAWSGSPGLPKSLLPKSMAQELDRDKKRRER